MDKKKKIILFSLLIAISFENLLWMSIICLFPIFISKHHPTINTFHTGLILSIFHFSTLIITPIVGQHLHSIGRKNALVLSYFCATLAALGYCSLSFVESTTFFYIGSVFIRLMEGVTTSLNATSVYALAPLEFPD
jgi:MFS family permease